jgi:transposase InsO family protein
MEEEIVSRKEAVNRWLAGEKPEKIAFDLGKTKQWVYKWIKRFQNDKGNNWFESQSTTPQRIKTKISAELENQILQIRETLAHRKYAQIGALSIQYEYYQLGLKPPPIWTINRVLQRNGVVKKDREKNSKNIPYPYLYLSCHQMDLVGPRYLKGGFRFYSFNIIDTQTHFVHVHPITGKNAEQIIHGIISFWQTYGFPDSLQMDNELAFKGSNKYPRSLGLILRFVLSQGVVPIFIPPAEPWRNGIIEKFNDKFNTKFYRVQEFIDFEHLKLEAKKFETFHNQNHRYSSQNNYTPMEMLNLYPSNQKLCSEFELKSFIPLETGEILFVRFIRSDLILEILGSQFFVKKELMYSYVVAELIIDIHTLRVKQDNQVHHVFQFDMPVDW